MRRDIQFLRGLAVTLVVLFHSNLGFFNYGYLGVDIFFVVSGFLITSIILKGLASDSFSFSSFYLRRAKRLLPALYCTLTFTTLLAVVFLTNEQWGEFLAQLVGAVTFTANMVLPTQIGYFEEESYGKALLHIWSLSIEEQYYFFLPVVLFIVPKKFRLHILCLMFILSIILCFSWMTSNNQSVPFLWRISDISKSEWAFYFFPARAWELLAGSICAWVMLTRPSYRFHPSLKWCSLILVMTLCVLNIYDIHPYIDAFLVVSGVSVMLLGKDDWLPDWAVFRAVEKIGDWSYSIYLVHWPLFAFSYLGYVGDVPTTTKIFLVLLAFILGATQYKLIESPLRSGVLGKKYFGWKAVVLSTSVIVLLPLLMLNSSKDEKVDLLSELTKANHGLSINCDDSFDSNGGLYTECLTSTRPNVAIWGDSYAMHLVPGLTESNKGIVQLTKSVCGPFLNLAPINSKYDENWAAGCLAFNKKAFEYIIANKSISHVVLSASFNQYINFSAGTQYLSQEGVIPRKHQDLINELQNTVTIIKNAGKVPVLFTPPPRTGFNIGECLVRQISNKVLLRDDCSITYDEYLRHEEPIIRIFDTLHADTNIFWLSDLLCDRVKCKTKIKGVPIYRDSGHLSIEGSQVLLKDIMITSLL